MRKYEAIECAKVNVMLSRRGIDSPSVGIAARSLSAMVRAATSNKSRNDLLTFAAGWPCVVQHPDFIV